ncbi:MAG: 23S rRNA (cytosine(2499)-C(5))-methyltransferase [Verrucomicrobiales bacterium]|nr:23S rRNA (cytosine(2499)-C(5))-methyltransferase [Verrucomicrobiales bacterium]
MKPSPIHAATNQPAATRLRLRITAAAESIVRSGHPWLFADSIHESNRAGQPGELAVIFDRKDKFLAVGLFDPGSPIRVRILHAGKPATIDAAWWLARLEQALVRRDDLFDAQTTGYRLIHGESDGWPGLVLDRYDTTLVLKIYTAAWLPRLDEILALFQKKIPCERIVLRLSRNIHAVAENKFQRRDGQILSGSTPSGPVIFSESGIRFEADVLRGQKTGFFLDQRENRREVETLARGRRVLNAFSFSGGFSVYAARGGAKSVTDLDISAHALESAKRNFALNQNFPGVAACRHETVQADAFEWLASGAGKFDLIVLDPPSLAKRAAEREGAIRAYERLNSQGIEKLTRDGILVAGSCSAHVSAMEFFDTVRHAAIKSGRKFTELKTLRHPPDHPAGFKEAEYLKVIYLEFAA